MSTIPEHIQKAAFDYMQKIDGSEKTKQSFIAGYQLATDGREELEKKVKELEEMFDTNWMEKYFIAFDQITALQSSLKEKEGELIHHNTTINNLQNDLMEKVNQLKEKEKECEELKQGIRNAIDIKDEYKDMYYNAAKIIEELKAENERLKRLVPDHPKEML